ncbi:MAG: PTS sugar transporter subunit IIA [Alkalibacterium sp.]|nr:PTS sugar transporter subunit IIA [Alkalibacterium sp.]
MFEEQDALFLYINANVDTQQQSKEGILKEVLKLIQESSSVTFDRHEVYRSVKEREEISTTGFGEGFAIPHGKSSDLNKPLVAVMKLAYGVDWEAMDEEEVNTVILLIVPEENGEAQHLKLLSKLSYNLMDDEIQKAIREAQTDKALHSTVQAMFTEL